MALLIPIGFLQAVYEFSFTQDAEQMVTTCGHELDQGSGANAEDAADDLMSAFATNIMPILTTDVTLTGVTVYVGVDGPNPAVRVSTLAGTVGGSGADALPPNSAILVRKRTDLAGRRGRGRMYLPGVPRGQVFDHGGLNTAYRDQVDLQFADWLDDLENLIGGRHYPPVVLHRAEGIGVEPPPTPIAAFATADKIATQRRRLRP